MLPSYWCFVIYHSRWQCFKRSSKRIFKKFASADQPDLFFKPTLDLKGCPGHLTPGLSIISFGGYCKISALTSLQCLLWRFCEVVEHEDDGVQQHLEVFRGNSWGDGGDQRQQRSPTAQNHRPNSRLKQKQHCRPHESTRTSKKKTRSFCTDSDQKTGT